MRETETKRKREWEADGTEAQITIGGGGGCGVKVSFKKREGTFPRGGSAEGPWKTPEHQSPHPGFG